MRILDVSGLGWDAAVVTVEGEKIALLETTLSDEKRVEALGRLGRLRLPES